MVTLLFFSGGQAGQGPQEALSPPARRADSRPVDRERKPQVFADRYKFEITLEPERGFLRAKAAVTLHASSALRDLEMELNPHLEIKSVNDAEGRPLDFARSRRPGSPKLSVILADSVPAEQPFVLDFSYQGSLPRAPLDYITADGVLLRDESRWYPAVDLAAFTVNEFKITLPADWQVFSSGQSQNIAETAAVKTVEWKSMRPVSSRSLVAAPALSCVRETQTLAAPAAVRPALALEVCTPADHEKQRSSLLKRVVPLIADYERLLGTFPVTQMTVIEGFPGADGVIGYSAPGFLVVSRNVSQYAGVLAFAPEFLPHELAHQWFPLEVVIERQDDGWLAESLAEYLSWRYLREKDPEAARRMVTAAMRDALEPDPTRPLALGIRIFALEPWSVTHATIYQRGMMIFRTLETVIDRERVDRALAEYFKRYQGRSASIADFQKICEEIAGRRLSWFFDYFLNGTRIPEIEIRQVPSGAPGIVAGDIVVKDMTPEATLRVEMRIRTAKGVVEHSVATRGEVTPFSVNVPAPAMSIELDPDLRILRWTEAARRHRPQVALLRQALRLEEESKIARALVLCRQALALDPEDVALNQQRIRFTIARLEYRQGAFAGAAGDFQAAQDGHSIDPVDTNFYRAWCRVYLARDAKRRGDTASARAEARAGLSLLAPALDARVDWSGSRSGEISAREALLELSKQELAHSTK